MRAWPMPRERTQEGKGALSLGEQRMVVNLALRTVFGNLDMDERSAGPAYVLGVIDVRPKRSTGCQSAGLLC